MRLLLLAGALLSPPALAQPADTAVVDAILSDMAGPQTPGCAVGVARGETTLVTRGYGSADLEHDVLIRADTIFEAGSVSKQFTAAAILLLAADGKLQLSDDVRKYVPELPNYGTTITIDHLLSHTSGLRDWGAVVSVTGWPRTTRAYTMEDVLAIIARQRSLNHAPGAEYSYTNSGYNLLAIIVGRVSGSSLAEFTKSRIFDPLGMRSTSWRDDFRRVVPGRAIAYERNGRVFRQNMPFEDAYGNGGLLTNVRDLLIWNDALSKGRLGSQLTRGLAERAVLSDGRRISYARGLFVQPFHGQAELAHGGATGGYRSWLGRYPGAHLSIAMLCNSPLGSPTALSQSIARAFLPAVPAPPLTAAPEATVRPADPALAGTFVSDRDGIPLKLKIETGRLKAVGMPPLDVSGGFKWETAKLSLEGPDRLQVTLPDGGKISYRRSRGFAPSAHDLLAYAGRYRSDEAGAVYVVTVTGKQLNLRLEERPHIEVPLRPAYEDTFELPEGYAKVPEGIIRFRRDARGAVRGLGFGISRVRDLQFLRVTETPNLRGSRVAPDSRERLISR